MRFRVLPILLVILAACSRDLPVETPLFSSAATASVSVSAEEDALVAVSDAVNAWLEAANADYRLSHAEWLGSDEAGTIVFFNNRGDKQLGHDFVPGDPRRVWGAGTGITYTIDETEGTTDVPPGQASVAIDRAMATWDNVQCSVLPLVKKTAPPVDFGVTELAFLGNPALPIVVADVAHTGWIPAGLPPRVLAATFTYIFFAGPGIPSDIDGNKRLDVAFREIIYNDQFPWRIDADVDIETVALHEAGHGLSQGHFGKAFRTLSNDQLHFAPRAVMNAGYSGVQQVISETDNAGHCTNWAGWPNK